MFSSCHGLQWANSIQLLFPPSHECRKVHRRDGRVPRAPKVPGVLNVKFWDRIDITFVYLNHSELSKLMEADGRRPGFVSNRPTSSLADADTFEKYSVGKEKSHRRILLVVSSSESSRNGESPLKKDRASCS